MEKIEIDELKGQVEAIQKAVKALKATGIREKVLLYAIQGAALEYHVGRIPMDKIKAVMQGMESLKEYLFPAEEDTP